MTSNIIVIGVDENHPLIEIASVEYSSDRNYEKIPLIDAITNMASLAAQAVPALLTAKEVASKQIMEVVIHGNLAKSADGNGLRAFSRATSTTGRMGKIQEHARLYQADNLSKIVNVAAVWQIASVVVAQKHLADINKKLEALQTSVDRIVDFLEVERKTRLLAIFESLKEKIESVSIATPEQRKQIINTTILSKYDDDLKQIYLHVKADIEKYGFESIKHKEMFGTADLKDGIEKKIAKMNELVQLAFLCLNLRLVCCHLMDHLEKMDSIKELQQQRILKELESFSNLFFKFEDYVNKEIEDMDSIVNKAQDAIKKNKGKIITANVLLRPILSVPLAIATVAVSSLFDQNSENQLGILGQRKAELRKLAHKFSVDCVEKYDYAQEIAAQGIHRLIKEVPPIKLAFQKLDDHQLLCLNTGEKITV